LGGRRHVKPRTRRLTSDLLEEVGGEGRGRGRVGSQGFFWRDGGADGGWTDDGGTSWGGEGTGRNCDVWIEVSIPGGGFEGSD